MKIVFVGDSLVSCTNVALAATWPEIAAKKLGFTAVNHAAGGRLTILMRGMFCSDALAEAPDGVFIQCGINDVLLDEPLEKMKENICVTLDTAKEGGIPLIMLGSPILARPESTGKGWQLPSEFAKHDAALKAYRQFLKQEAARRDLPFFDMEAVFEAIQEKASENLLVDGIHPNEKGYAALADAFVDFFRPLMGDRV